MPKTISAADQVRRSNCPPGTSRQAGDLLQALATVECHFSVGGPAAVPTGLLRDLATITERLVGPGRLEDGAAGTTIATAGHTPWQPPSLPELDQILARALSDRFGAPSAAA